MKKEEMMASRADLSAHVASATETDAQSELERENAALTKALTGLTCGGSEFFIRKGDRFVADIDACVGWVRRVKEDAHRSRVNAILDRKAAEARAAVLLEAVTTLLEAMELQGGRETGAIHLSQTAMEVFWAGAKAKARAAISPALSSGETSEVGK